MGHRIPGHGYMFVRVLIALSLLVITCSSRVFAAEGGLSNYIPGFYGDLALAVEVPDGFSTRNDLFFFDGEAGRSLRSGQVQIEVDVNLLYDYLTIIYKPKAKLLGTPMAFGVTAAAGNVDIEADVNLMGNDIRIEDERTGIGDVTLSAVAYFNSGKFHWSLNNYLVVPIGEYDTDNLANASLNYWTYEVDIALTYFEEEMGQDYSVVVGYGYNTENSDTDYQSGDEVHVDFVLNQFLTESFGMGINGYFYKQVGDDSGDGAILGGFRGEGAGIGPAIYYIKKIGGKDVYFSAKWVHDYHAENRIKGDYVYVSFALSI